MISKKRALKKAMSLWNVKSVYAMYESSDMYLIVIDKEMDDAIVFISKKNGKIPIVKHWNVSDLKKIEI